MRASLACFFAVLYLCVPQGAAQSWLPMGPPGGDVRALAADPFDPQRIYLGASDGHIFGSRNAGRSWELLGRAGTRRDAVITAILVDPRKPSTLFASTWTMDPLAGGGVFRSGDGGRTWQAAGLERQAVRALAMPPSDSSLLVAGTLEGVFRTRDAGATWERISPEGHEEIRNLDSIAIDPRDSEVIYAGTYHLPWKTTDGGRRWFAIHTGMIDDSDVMSIEIDRTNPQRLYASACSGIYRSDNGGGVWRKIQGIPYSARRTHVIRQDPQRPRTLYAATTEGLWKTADAGATWQRMTPRDWVVNALVIDAAEPDRLVMGTEKLGVLVSSDAGRTFTASNEGFNHRQIVAVALHPERPGRVLAILANAPEAALVTDDGGITWEPLGPGLGGQPLAGVYAAPDGWWVALERGGLMRYDEGKRAWVRAGMAVGEIAYTVDRRGRRTPSRVPRPLVQHVADMAFSRDAWFAATEDGLLVSRDHGDTWELFPAGPMPLPMRSVRVSHDGRQLWVVSMRGMIFSRDGGESWSWHDLPFGAGAPRRLEIADEKTLLATADEGLYISRDSGRSWQKVARGLPQVSLKSLVALGDVFLASMHTGGLFVSRDQGQSWARVEGDLAEGHFPAVGAPAGAAMIYAASSTEGLYRVEFPRAAQAAGANGNGP